MSSSGLPIGKPKLIRTPASAAGVAYASATAAKAVSDGDYVTVGDGDEKKDASNAPSIRSMKVAVDQMFAGSHRPKTATARIWSTFTATSSATTFLSSVSAIKPGVFTEAGSFAAIFDQAKCVGGEVYIRAWSNGTNPEPSKAWASSLSFSDEYSSITSVVELLAASDHLGPVAVGPGNTTSPAAPGVQAMSSTGFLKYHFKVPRGTALNPAVSGAPVGGSWFATSDSSAAVAFLNVGIDALSAGTSQFIAYVALDMVYRSRQ